MVTSGSRQLQRVGEKMMSSGQVREEPLCTGKGYNPTLTGIGYFVVPMAKHQTDTIQKREELFWFMVSEY